MDRQLRRMKGVREKHGKIQAFVWVAGRFHSATFPLDTTPAVVRAWQLAEKKAFGKSQGSAAPTEGSFAADVVEYLARVQAMPTIRQRGAHLRLWQQALGGDRARDSVTPADVTKVMQAWLIAPRLGGRSRATLNPATVSKRRASLAAFYVELNGEDGYNPVAKTKPPKSEKRGAPLAIPMADVAAALAQMPDHHTPPARGLSLSKLRATVIASTGVPPSLLKKLRRADINWKARTWRLEARLKGGGVEPRTLPLTDDALAALRAFDAADAYGGAWAVNSLNRSFKRGAQKAGLSTKVHLYVLRHSFLTALYRATRDLATVGRFAMHAENSPMTLRYARAAFEDVDAAAAATLSAALVEQRRAAIRAIGPKAGQNLAQKRARKN